LYYRSDWGRRGHNVAIAMDGRQSIVNAASIRGVARCGVAVVDRLVDAPQIAMSMKDGAY